MYISDLIKEMFKQTRLESAVQFFILPTSKESRLPTRGRSRNIFLEEIIFRRVVKRK